MQVLAGRRADGDALLLHAWSSRARAVAAFVSDAVATQSGYEIAGFVPRRYVAASAPECRFRHRKAELLADQSGRGAHVAVSAARLVEAVVWLPHPGVIALIPTSISLAEPGADFPFPRGAAAQSDGREQAQLLRDTRSLQARMPGRYLSRRGASV